MPAAVVANSFNLGNHKVADFSAFWQMVQAD
jgi:hypothetical protein